LIFLLLVTDISPITTVGTGTDRVGTQGLYHEEKIKHFCVVFFLKLTHSMDSSLSREATTSQLVNNFSKCFATRSFITVLTRACHWFLSWARRTQFTSSHFSKIYFNIVTRLVTVDGYWIDSWIYYNRTLKYNTTVSLSGLPQSYLQLTIHSLNSLTQ
jgi:hypothetical protein